MLVVPDKVSSGARGGFPELAEGIYFADAEKKRRLGGRGGGTNGIHPVLRNVAASFCRIGKSRSSGYYWSLASIVSYRSGAILCGSPAPCI